MPSFCGERPPKQGLGRLNLFGMWMSANELRMIQRQQLVQSVVQELQDAAECFGLEGLTSAVLEAERTLSSFSLPRYCGRQVQEELEVDQVAKGLYPEDAPSHMLPLVCKGEQGDHLFEAASMLLWGDTSLSLELQARTAVEMLLHKQYYLNGMIDSKVMLQAARYSLCTEKSPEMTNLPLAVLEAIFDVDTKATCFPGTYANMWHLYALASVLQCNIYSIYPMSNLNIRPYFNRVIRPRRCNLHVSTLHIMWSGQQISPQVFIPQYFVPVIGLVEVEPTDTFPEPPAQPVKTLELLNKDPQVTYSNLHVRHSITKSTFYRWKRQSREHRQKAAARFAAKQFLQSCFQQGNTVSLQHFQQRFPEISRSTYYAWKHEMQNTLNVEVSSLAEVVSPHNLHADKLEKRHAGTDRDAAKSEGGMGPKSPLLNSSQNGTSMQGAKSYLEHCISMNTLVPFRSFKCSFPGISRSTYYNWRRKAMKENPNFKPTQPFSINQDSLMNRKPYLTLNPGGFPSKKKLSCHQQLHDLPKKCVKIPFCNFRRRYQSLGYWTWKQRSSSLKKKKPLSSNKASQNLQQAAVETNGEAEPAFHSTRQEEAALLPGGEQAPKTFNTMIPGNQRVERVNNDNSDDSDMFVMDVIAAAQFKARAKQFLQQRYDSDEDFPGFKEFRAHFPHTARSTYYMWKRALQDGLSLVSA